KSRIGMVGGSSERRRPHLHSVNLPRMKQRDLDRIEHTLHTCFTCFTGRDHREEMQVAAAHQPLEVSGLLFEGVLSGYCVSRIHAETPSQKRIKKRVKSTLPSGPTVLPVSHDGPKKLPLNRWSGRTCPLLGTP